MTVSADKKTQKPFRHEVRTTGNTRIFLKTFHQRKGKQNIQTPISSNIEALKTFEMGYCIFMLSCLQLHSSSQDNLGWLANKNLMLGAFPPGDGCSAWQQQYSHLGFEISIRHTVSTTPCTFCFHPERRKGARNTGTQQNCWDNTAKGRCSVRKETNGRGQIHREAGLSTVEWRTAGSRRLWTCTNCGAWELRVRCTQNWNVAVLSLYHSLLV